jgi:uncharacterized protein (TIGR03437 family)
MKLAVLTFATVSFACATNFATHYIPLGTNDSSIAILADAAGNIFIVSQIGDANGFAVRTTKTDPNGRILSSATTNPHALVSTAALDPQGNLLVAGAGFITKLDNSLTQVIATSILGALAMTTDSDGNVWVAGQSGADFPTTPGAYLSNPTAGAGYAYVAKLTPDLGTIVAATLFGNYPADCNPVSASCRGANGPGVPASTIPDAIAITPSGSILLAGSTSAAPAKVGIRPYAYGFVAKFSGDLTTLQSQSVYNPNADTVTNFRSIAVDAQGNVLLAGGSADRTAFPPGGVQPNAPNAAGGGIVFKLDPDLNYVWGTYFGSLEIPKLALDGPGNIWLTGSSPVSALPNATSTSIAQSAFVAQLTRDGNSILSLVTSQLGGGSLTTLPSGDIAVVSTSDAFLLPAAPEVPGMLLVANSANNQSSGSIAPAELISLYGANIGPAAPAGGVVVDGAFSTSVAGCQVLFNGTPSPILYAGPNQMNVVAPVAILGQTAVDITVIGPDRSTAFPTVFVADSRPQFFSEQRTFPGGPDVARFAIASNQDGSLNSASKPASLGSVVTLWVSGAGLTENIVADGAIGTSASALKRPISIPNAEIEYAGQAPGAIQGLTQVNVRIPGDAFVFGPTLWPLTIQQGNTTSAIVDIAITNNQ